MAHVTAYAALLSVLVMEMDFHFEFWVQENRIFLSRPHASVWRNFPQTSDWLHASQPHIPSTGHAVLVAASQGLFGPPVQLLALHLRIVLRGKSAQEAVPTARTASSIPTVPERLLHSCPSSTSQTPRASCPQPHCETADATQQRASQREADRSHLQLRWGHLASANFPETYDLGNSSEENNARSGPEAKLH